MNEAKKKTRRRYDTELKQQAWRYLVSLPDKGSIKS